MLGRDHLDYVELRLDDMFKAQAVVNEIVARLGAAYPTDWADLNRNLFQPCGWKRWPFRSRSA